PRARGPLLRLAARRARLAPARPLAARAVGPQRSAESLVGLSRRRRGPRARQRLLELQRDAAAHHPRLGPAVVLRRRELPARHGRLAACRFRQRVTRPRRPPPPPTHPPRHPPP